MNAEEMKKLANSARSETNYDNVLQYIKNAADIGDDFTEYPKCLSDDIMQILIQNGYVVEPEQHNCKIYWG